MKTKQLPLHPIAVLDVPLWSFHGFPVLSARRTSVEVAATDGIKGSREADGACGPVAALESVLWRVEGMDLIPLMGFRP